LLSGPGGGGDLPPRPECAALWHEALLARLPNIAVTLLIGHHAQRQYLRERRQPTLAATVRHWRDYAPRYLPLPHPSPRNQPWMLRHPWFAREVLPALEHAVAHALA
jgi:uracil-DNA glycosylase